MKTIINYINEKKTKFIIKGHTKNQQGPFSYFSINEIRSLGFKSTLKQNKIIFGVSEANSMNEKRLKNDKTDEELTLLFNTIIDVLNGVYSKHIDNFNRLKCVNVYFVGGLGGFTLKDERNKEICFIYCMDVDFNSRGDQGFHVTNPKNHKKLAGSSINELVSNTVKIFNEL